MINMPIIKFEKSVNYLTKQLEIQENNKQLLLDITANLKLMSNSYANDKKLNEILDLANNYLQIISTNITTIEKSELEISNITNELSDLLNDKNRTSKTKEYYIIAFSNIKNSIVTYTNSFLELQKKLEIDNNNLNDFINTNNFKYNFTAVSDKEEPNNEYEYTGFSVNNEESNINYKTEISSNSNVQNVETDTPLDNSLPISIEDIFSIEELSNKTNLNNNSDISNDTSIDDIIIDNALSDNYNTDTIENISNSQISENEPSLIPSNDTINVDALAEDVNDNNISIEDIFELENLSNEINSKDSVPTEEVIENTNPDISDTDITIDDLINNFTDEDLSLDNISVDDISIEDLTDIISDDISIDDLTDTVTDNDIPVDNLTDINTDTDTITDNDITLDDLTDIDTITDGDISIEDLTEITTSEIAENNLSDDILSSKLLSENLDDKTEKNIQSHHYSYNELKDELNKMFSEINGIIEEKDDTHHLDTTIVEDIKDNNVINSYNDIDDNTDIVLDDIDLSKIELTEQNIDFTQDSIIKQPNNTDTDEIDENNIEETEEIVVDNSYEISDSSFVDNNLKFKEKISNNTFSLIEEEIFDEYSSFELPAKKEESTNETEVTSDSYKDANDTSSDISLENLPEELLNEFVTTSLVQDNNIDNQTIENDIIDNSINNENIFEELNSSFNDVSTESVINKENTPSQIDVNIDEIQEKINQILSANSDNSDLVISERTRKIYLPYAIEELIEYIENYPDVYSSLTDVVEQEFVLSFDYFISHPIKARFEETYNLIKNRVHKSSFDALKFALRISKMDNLNPAIIAACKTDYDLNNYIYHLNSNSLQKFKAFKIYYDINPL